jgi:hypothetical protein
MWCDPWQTMHPTCNYVLLGQEYVCQPADNKLSVFLMLSVCQSVGVSQLGDGISSHTAHSFYCLPKL